MKAKLVKESLNERTFDTVYNEGLEMEDVRDAILSGDVYKNPPSKYDPGERAVYIPYLSSDTKIFFYTLIGEGDVYGIESIDSNGIISEVGNDIAGGQLDEDEIMERIQDLFPRPPMDMEEIGHVKSTEEFMNWFNTFGDDEY